MINFTDVRGGGNKSCSVLSGQKEVACKLWHQDDNMVVAITLFDKKPDVPVDLISIIKYS